MEKHRGKMIGVVSLGCDKNRVDTETMLTRLRSAGFGFTSNPENADVIIINTCAFIKPAREESENMIAEMIKYKQLGNCKKIIVTGCYPKIDYKQLSMDFQDVDVFMGTNDYKNIVEIVNEALMQDEKTDVVRIDNHDLLDFEENNRLITTPFYYAYLKIAEGCDNFCTYCRIPYIRGRYRSREIESLVCEAKSLVKNGAREIILVAQDITKYGKDIYKKPRLVELIQKLSKIEELRWIRLLYAYPEDVTDELITEILENDKVCKYIDIPLQHVSNDILKRMNRKIDSARIENLLTKLRSNERKISIRTTFILGFPGETRSDQKQLIEFIKRHKLNNVGFFEFSPEEGTQAYNFENRIESLKIKRRMIEAVRAQKKIVKINNKMRIGQVVQVVYEGVDERTWKHFGRSEYESPEIDPIIFLESDKDLKIGEFYKAKITKSVGYDLKAKVL